MFETTLLFFVLIMTVNNGHKFVTSTLQIYISLDGGLFRAQFATYLLFTFLFHASWDPFLLGYPCDLM